MLFVTREFFLGFLPIVLAAFHLSLALGLRKLLLPILLIGSVVFYAWGNPSETPILAVSILVNYLTGRALVDLNLPAPRRKAVFILALVFNLGLLAFFKYTNFALDNLAALFDLAPRHINIALPIGISFYTFTQIAFLTDIYRNGERQRDLASYSLFVTYFPHLVAGPIIHWREVMPQFRMLGRKEGLAFASSVFIWTAPASSQPGWCATSRSIGNAWPLTWRMRCCSPQRSTRCWAMTRWRGSQPRRWPTAPPRATPQWPSAS